MKNLLTLRWGAGSKVCRFFLLTAVLLISLLLAQPALAQERQTDMTLRLVPNRAGLIEVEAGKDNPLFLEVSNIGKNALTNITLSSDKDEGWAINFKPAAINSLAPGSLQTVNVSVLPPPNVAGGVQSINIIAEAKEIRKVENFTLTVRTATLTMRLLTTDRVPFTGEVRAGQDNAFLLEVNNFGNKVATGIKFSSDATSGWVVNFSPAQIDSIAPGSIQTVKVTIRPPAKATIEANQITIIAESNETRQVEPFFMTVKPAQAWLWVWIVAGVVVVAIFVFIYMRFSKQS